jgi:hypothetical protein
MIAAAVGNCPRIGESRASTKLQTFYSRSSAFICG